jgi:hypothetical protein
LFSSVTVTVACSPLRIRTGVTVSDALSLAVRPTDITAVSAAAHPATAGMARSGYPTAYASANKPRLARRTPLPTDVSTA